MSPAASFPAYFTSFVGRDAEVAAALTALQAGPLVTIVGPGGIGKTRLAVEVARAWSDANPADVLFVDLSTVGEESLPLAIFRQIAPMGSPDGEQALYRYLEQGTALLILDNCEHLAAPAARVARTVLRSCPRTRILATSRMALGVEGEVRVPLGPLRERGAAQTLFIDRARAADATLTLSGPQLEDVEAICAGLDGMPLALELAAASVRASSVGDIRARLAESLDAFESPVRDAPERQRTLRGAIEWSFGLLSDRERLLLARLAVFSGGWRLDSAEEVCSGDGIERRQVAASLRRLVEHGLVLLDPNTGRYRLLEPIREFAAELLPAQSEWEERHAAGFSSLTERLAGDFHSPPRAAQARLREEDDNLLKAAEWSYASARLESGLRIVAASARHWRVRGATRWLAPATRLTNHPDARGYGELWAVACLRTVSLEFFGDGREFEVIASLRQIAETLTGSQYQTEAWIELGLRLATVGQTDEAIRLLERGHQQAEEREDPALRMHALHGLSELAMRTGDSHSLWGYAEEMLGLARKIDNPFLTGLALRRMADAQGAVGHSTEAEALLREAERTLDGWDDGTAGPADPGGPLATLLLLQGRFNEAAEVLRATLVRSLRGGDTYTVPLLVGGLGVAVGRSGSPGLGTRLLAASLAEVRRRGLVIGDVLHAQLKGSLQSLEGTAGPALFRDERAKGEQLSIMDAVELALNATVAPEAPAAVAAKLPGGLTAREAEILRLLAAGKTNREIAAELVLSLRTVETHIFNIYTKTDTGGRAAATGWAIANGIYDPRT